MIKTFIPTYRRVKNQITLERLDCIPEIKEHVYLVVDHSEKDRFNYDRVLVTPEALSGIGPTRQWILENAGADKFLMMDDDLSFYRRVTPHEQLKRKATDQDIIDMYRWFDKALNKYMHAGVAHQFTALFERSTTRTCVRIACLLGYRGEAVKYSRFDRVVWAEDHDMTLQLLERGYLNIENCEFMYNQIRNAPGGCSEYRQLERMIENAQTLVRLHPPGVVTIGWKKFKNPNWKKVNPTGERPVYRFKWRKAYEHSKGLI